MRALTCCEPFASAIVFGGKDIENRGRRLGIYGPTIIHAGKGDTWWHLSPWVNSLWPECPNHPKDAMRKFWHRKGLALGVAYFDQAFEEDKPLPARWAKSQWRSGPWCLPILGVIAVQPFPLIGRQGPFTVPAASLPQDVIDAAELLTDRHGRNAA